LEYWSKKGYWAFAPRYRGTWESDGVMLARSPAKDILDLVGGISVPFKDFFFGKSFRIKAKKIVLFGASYGAVPALLAASDDRISKIVLLCPLVDWSKEGPEEPLDELLPFVKKAFGQAFRINETNWRKLKTGKLFNPINDAKKIDGSKLMLIHTKDDRVVPYQTVKRFADTAKAKLISLNKGGHLSMSLLHEPKFSRLVQKFLK
jgi:pimeloyl-ACP methyl ester carboxylesterase